MGSNRRIVRSRGLDETQQIISFPFCSLKCEQLHQMAAEEMGPTTHFTLQTKSFAVIMICPGQNFKIVVQDEEEPLLSPSSLSFASLAFQGELIASESGLLSHGPLVHLILTRWRASDNGTVKCASGWRGRVKKTHTKNSALITFEAKRSLVASGSEAGKLNEHLYSCVPAQIYVSRGFGAAHRWGVAPAQPGKARKKTMRSWYSGDPESSLLTGWAAEERRWI